MIRPGSILAVCAFLLLAPRTAHAFHLRTADGTNRLELAAGETLERESLLLGPDVDIRGRALRDLWVLAGASIRYEGESAGDLRMLSRTTVIDGHASENLWAYGMGLQLTTNSVVNGQAALLGQTIVCEGRIDGDAWILARTVTLGGQWGGTVRVQAAEIRVMPGTRIAGDLVYTAPKAPVIDSSVVVGGAVEPRAAMLPEAGEFSPVALQSRLMLHGYLFLAALLVGMPFVGFFPMLSGGALHSLRSSPWRVLLIGLAAILGGPFLIAFAAMTIIGIPLAILLAALYLLVLYLSHLVVALWVGHWIIRSSGPATFGRVLTRLAAGLAVLYIAAALPGILSLLGLPVAVLGAGALLGARLPGTLVAIPHPPGMPPFQKPGPPEQPPS